MTRTLISVSLWRRVLQSGANRRAAATGTSQVGSSTAVLLIGSSSALPLRSCRFSFTVIAPTAKCRRALAPALQAAPSLLASLDSQIVRRQRVSAAAMAWNIVTRDFAAIDIGEVNNRRTITREQAPATKIILSNSIPYKIRTAAMYRGPR